MDGNIPQGAFGWLVPSLLKNSDISQIEAIDETIWLVRRKNKMDFTIGLLSVPSVSVTDINGLFLKGNHPGMVVNIPRECRWEGAAITGIQSRGIAWGGVGDIHRAVHEDNPRNWKSRTRAFVERALGQHTSVAMLTPITDKIYLISRHGLPDLKFIMIHEYTLTAEHVRYARELHGEFDEILNTDPNGSATTGAKEIAKSIGSSIFSMRTFLGRLGSR